MTRIKLAEGVYLTDEKKVADSFVKGEKIGHIYGMDIIQAKHFCKECPVPNPNVPDDINEMAYERHLKSFGVKS